MNDVDLERHLRGAGGPRPAGHAAELVPLLLAQYAARGAVVGATLPALHRACDCAAGCWQGLEPGAKAPARDPDDHAPGEKGSIFLPWIGPGYREGGICVVGMNLRYRGLGWALGVEYEIAADPKHGQEQALRAGRRAHGSAWSTFTMRDVLVVRRARGEIPMDVSERDGDALADCLMVSARLQAVKCSPIGGRGGPSRAMTTNCPPPARGAAGA